MAPSSMPCRVLKEHVFFAIDGHSSVVHTLEKINNLVTVQRLERIKRMEIECTTTFHQVSAQTFSQVPWEAHQAVWTLKESFGRAGGQAARILRCLSMASLALAIMQYIRMLIWSRSSFERLFKGVLRSSQTAGATQSCISYRFASLILSVAGILSRSSQCRANLMLSWIYHILHIWRMSTKTSLESSWGSFHELKQGQN